MPPRTRFNRLNCSLAQTLDRLGDGWSLLIVRTLFMGAHRFGELQSSLGIARTVLTARLEQLEHAGILERRGTEQRPLYFLTKKGRDLFPVLVALMQWGDRWAASGGAPVKLTDARGRAAAPMTVQTRDGVEISADKVRFSAGPGAAAATKGFLKLMAASKQDRPSFAAAEAKAKTEKTHG